MRPPIPEPLTLPWDLKENLTAKSGVDELRDGRTKYWVDEILTGITPTCVVVQRRHPRRHGDRRPPSFEVPGLASL